MLWNTDGIGLTGRDEIIKKLQKYVQAGESYVIQGPANVGLTALLEFLHQLTKGSCLINADNTNSTNLDKIIEDWGLLEDGEKKPAKVDDKQEKVMKAEGKALFVDNVHLASPKVLRFLKILSQRHHLYMSVHDTSGGLKEDLKEIMSAVDVIKIKPLDKKHTDKLSKKMALHHGELISHEEIARASNGLPGRMASMARTGKIYRDPIRPKSMEIDESWIVLVVAVIMVSMRVFGLVADDRAMYLIGGCSIFLLFLGRVLVSAGKQK